MYYEIGFIPSIPVFLYLLIRNTNILHYNLTILICSYYEVQKSLKKI